MRIFRETSFVNYLRFCLMSTDTTWLVEYFSVRINRLFGKFPPLEHRIFWWPLGSVERSPSVGSLCHALEFSSLNRVPICWLICTKQCHPSRYLRIHLLELSRPIQQRSIPKLPSLVPCCVAIISNQIECKAPNSQLFFFLILNSLLRWFASKIATTAEKQKTL